MIFAIKRKRFILIATFILINMALVLGFTVNKWFSPNMAVALEINILVPSGCYGEETPINLQVNNEFSSSYTVRWDFGDGDVELAGGINTKHTYMSTGTFSILASVYNGDHVVLIRKTQTVTIENCDDNISENCCEGSFAPISEKKYMISAWVKEEGNNLKSFEEGYITLAFGYINPFDHPLPRKIVLGPFYAKGNIIDGWQRIEESFVVPKNFETISVRVNNKGDNDNVFFDDIRIFPFDGNMKSYVYDTETKRLVAEMDQNNYATVYEYSDEGEMIRIKKETERGMMTISESRSGLKKQ